MDIKMWPSSNFTRYQAWKEVESGTLNNVSRYFVLDTLTCAQFNYDSEESVIASAKRMNVEHQRNTFERQYESRSGRW